ncbi:MAG: 6-hydroxymethylpterin diphosphokinase MptE-like protein, partial [Candidatus Thorarchaeota archaeon]
ATALLEVGLRCDIIVTDLDGDIDDIRTQQEQGALVIVHAHGDNIDSLRAIVPTLQPILASTQVEPTERAFLWGGFTDGDRACHIISHYNPESVVLAGMDFGKVVGRWSKPERDEDFPADERKQIKLSIAEELVHTPLVQSNIEFTVLE